MAVNQRARCLYPGGLAPHSGTQNETVTFPYSPVSGSFQLLDTSGQELTLNTDVSKWTIADGWLPGKYKVALRIDHLQVDRYAALSIVGEPLEFEIKN